MPVKTANEVEEGLKKEYENKLRVDNKLILDPSQIQHGWSKEDEETEFWPMLLYPDIFNYLKLYHTQLGSTDFNDYKTWKLIAITNLAYKLASAIIFLQIIWE